MPYKKGQKWIAQVRKEGKRLEKVFPTKKQASGWEAKMLRKPVSDWNVKTDTVSLGTVVQVTNLTANRQETFGILGAWDSEPEKGVVSYLSPMAQALLGHKVGDQVEPGDVLAEIETDKATMEFESFDAAFRQCVECYKSVDNSSIEDHPTPKKRMDTTRRVRRIGAYPHTVHRRGRSDALRKCRSHRERERAAHAITDASGRAAARAGRGARDLRAQAPQGGWPDRLAARIAGHRPP